MNGNKKKEEMSNKLKLEASPNGRPNNIINKEDLIDIF